MYRRLTNDRSLKISVTLPCHVVDIVDTVDINIDTVNIVILLAFWYCWHCWHCRLATGNLLNYRTTLLTLKSMLTVIPHSAQWNQSLSDTIFWTIQWLNFCQKVFLMHLKVHFIFETGVLLGMGNPLLDISANVKVKPSCKSFWECCAWEQEIWNRKLHYYLLILFHSQSCWRSTVGRPTMPFSPRRKLSLRSWRSTRFDTSRYCWCLHPLHVGHRSGWSHCWWSYSELNQGGTVAPGWTSNDDFEMFWNGATCFV